MDDPRFFFALKCLTLAAEAWVLWTLYLQRSKDKTLWAWLTFLLVSHFASDAINLLTGQYAFPKLLEGIAPVAAKFPLRFVHVAFVGLIVSELPRGWRRLLRSPQVAIGMGVILPVAWKLIACSPVIDLNRLTLEGGNELFLFAVFLLSFPLALLVLSGTTRDGWSQLAAGTLVAAMAGIGKRFELAAGLESDSGFYEVTWTLAVMLQSLGAWKLSRSHEHLDDVLRTGSAKTAQSFLLGGMYLAIVAIINANEKTAQTIEHAIFMGIVGTLLAVTVTGARRKTRQALVRDLRKVLAEPNAPQLERWEQSLPYDYQEPLVLMLQDRDRLLRLKEEERHNQNLDGEVAEMRREVCDRVMHDIRSPLAALAFVTRDLNEISEDKRAIIGASLERITGIANELLDWGRKTSSAPQKQLLAREPIAHLLVSAAEEKRVEWERHMKLSLKAEAVGAAAVGAVVKINKSRFLAVVSNLLNNAGEAMQFSGTVNLSLNRGGTSQKTCEIEVEDQGPGMPPELCARLGKERISVGKENGNGIGVLSARHAVEEWGGRLDVFSQLGRGTRIRITLPLWSD